MIDYRFKILYALGIIFVVAGHCKYGGVSLLYEWFPPYAFHLGLFVFASGYFYKSSVENEIGKYIIKKVKTLIIPLYLWNLFYGIVVTLLSFKGFTMGDEITIHNLLIQPITNGHQFSYNRGGWFVIPLFMVQVYNVLIRKIFKNINEYIYFIFNVFLGVFGVYIASKGYNFGWWLVLVRFLYFIPFYSLGILYKNKLEKYDNMMSIKYFLIIIICELFIIYFYEHTPSYTPSWCNDFTEGPFLPFIVGFLGIAFWLRVSKVLEPAIGKNKYIALLSDNTYSIMINHFMGFMIVKTIFAMIDKFTVFCSDFNWESYKSDAFYLYLPKGLNQMKVLYLVAGIVFPIVFQLLINKVWNMIKLKRVEYKINRKDSFKEGNK